MKTEVGGAWPNIFGGKRASGLALLPGGHVSRTAQVKLHTFTFDYSQNANATVSHVRWPVSQHHVGNNELLSPIV